MKYKVSLNGKIYEVEVKEGEAILLDEYEAQAPAPVTQVASPSVAPVAQAPAPAPVAGGGEQVVAPLPGNVLKVLVKAGDTVKAGQVLILLEAMKMENEIIAEADGTVSQVFVSAGAIVSTGTPLLAL